MAGNLFTRSIPSGYERVAKDRFDLTPGIFFAYYLYKNLWWILDGVTIGYGDLRLEDITHIQENLREGEVFKGMHESHGSGQHMTDLPIVHITIDEVTTPHRSKVWA